MDNFFKKSLTALLAIALSLPVFSQTARKWSLAGSLGFGISRPVGLKSAVFGNNFLEANPAVGGLAEVSAYHNFGATGRLRVALGVATKNYSLTCDCSRYGSENDPNNPGTYLRDPKLDDKVTHGTTFLRGGVFARKIFGQRRFRSFLEIGGGLAANISEKNGGSPAPPTPYAVIVEKTRLSPFLEASVGLMRLRGFSLSANLELFLNKTKLKSQPASYRYATPGLVLGFFF